MLKLIEAREKLREICVDTLAGINTVPVHKLDRVEKFPSCCVYISEVESSRGAMRALRMRKYIYEIVIYRAGETDITERLTQDLNVLEIAIENRKGEFMASPIITGAEFNYPTEGKGSFGAVTIIINIEHSEQI